MQTQKVKYPSQKIRIGQRNWIVQVVPPNYPRLGKGNWGRCQWEEQTIYVSNRLGQKNFKQTSTHELLHAFLDSIGFHDKLLRKLKNPAYEKLVDGLADCIMPLIRPEVFKIPNHIIQKRVKTRD